MTGLLVLAGAPHAKILPRIGFLGWTPCETSMASAQGEWSFVLKGLAEYGYRPHDNITIVCRSANGRIEQFGPAASELAKIPVDIIVGNSDMAVAAAGQATHTIPVIGIHTFMFGNSYSAPYGNITGIGNISLELSGKRLELLKRAVPQIRRLAVLSNPVGFYRADEMRIKRAGQELETELIFFRVKESNGLAEVFAQMKAQNVDAVFILPDLMFAGNAPQIADLALKYDLATMAADEGMAEAGCLMSYSSKTAELEQRLASFADRILKGANAGNLPFEKPNNFVLSINLRTAGALGITLPRDLLMMANEVVE
jgi:putative tryptophan/tyrosine transport system substrate-binding protein